MNPLNPKTKNKIITALIAVVVVILLALFLREFTNPNDTPPPPNGDTFESDEEQIIPSITPLTEDQKLKQDQDALLNALNSGATSDCDAIEFDEAKAQTCRDKLHYNSALTQKDTRFCDQIADELLQLDCYDDVILKSRVRTRNEDQCEQLSDSELKTACEDELLMSVARLTKNIEDCSAISSSQMQSACEDAVYLGQTGQSQNERDCEKISDPDLRQRCAEQVADNQAIIENSDITMNQKDNIQSAQDLLKLCEQRDDEAIQACRNAVYPRIAFEEKNLSICDQITEIDLMLECKSEQGQLIDEYHLNAAILERDISLCDRINDSNMKENCLTSLASNS